MLPQAARHFLPVYQGEFISLVKMTSVVGYIAIQDLTKASDIIRSRTYEAFFPLITTAIIYFAIAWFLTRVLMAMQKRLDPSRRRNRLLRHSRAQHCHPRAGGRTALSTLVLSAHGHHGGDLP